MKELTIYYLKPLGIVTAIYIVFFIIVFMSGCKSIDINAAKETYSNNKDQISSAKEHATAIYNTSKDIYKQYQEAKND